MEKSPIPLYGGVALILCCLVYLVTGKFSLVAGLFVLAAVAIFFLTKSRGETPTETAEAVDGISTKTKIKELITPWILPWIIIFLICYLFPFDLIGRAIAATVTVAMLKATFILFGYTLMPISALIRKWQAKNQREKEDDCFVLMGFGAAFCIIIFLLICYALKVPELLSIVYNYFFN